MLTHTILNRCVAGVALTTTLMSAPAIAQGRALAPVSTGSPVMGPESSAMYVAPPVDSYRRWSDERRKLRVQVGVSAGLAAAFLLGSVLALTVSTCNPPPGAPDEYCGMPLGPLMLSGVLASAAVVTTVPAVVFGVRLGRHNRQRPVAQLQLAPGGLALRF